MINFNQVLLVAGTHGNELSGIYINKLIKDGLYKADRASFKTESILANPNAIEKNVRFVDCDLNRQFTPENRTLEHSEQNEVNVAKELMSKYSDVDNQLVIDLHNTTSNMGATLILLATSPFYTKMGAYVKEKMPEANILFEDRKEWAEQPYLCSLGQHGVMIEVGEQAHSSLKFETLELMKTMLTHLLDYVELHNQNALGKLKGYEGYFYTEEVTVPLDSDGMRAAIVHPDICGKDFEAVQPGQPLLKRFTGEDIIWEGSQQTYPHFINESAYCAADNAMALADKKFVEIS